ncbi:MAG: tRNA (N6-isopentenyl adenosine(37)-C2)-methylthiotransferase MiaB [Candidatus Latescibacteria bacterium]|nr:tRNA (N6-isopentenyl adenosine(37)-C2)-methylthiotransferase MiaB [bacterium]MCB9515141.1 tRNA (N6-isopentenyl adenosine(37)-C2)-methylthiotransferase MiaB [Candidatus Latescibacterota bacterium]
MSRKFYVETYGCQMNAYDTQVIEGVLEAEGLEKVERPEESDLIIINTCSVRDQAEQRVLGRINQLDGLRRGRDSRLLMGVVGCMAQRLGPTLIGGTRGRVDFVVGPQQYKRLPAILAKVDAETEAREEHYFTDFDHVVTYQAKPKLAPPGGSHFVAVMHGCDKFCSYCVVPFTRGRERSKDWRHVLEEVEMVAAQGGFEVTLLGQTISSYRFEDVDFAGLLEKVHAVEGIESIRFMTSYPTDMTEALFDRIGSLPKVGTGIHLPFQSGSDAILKAMNRRYSIGEYESILARGRRAIDDLLYSTDIIVGYPGETEADFQATLDVVERQDFISAFMFKYSPREGTLAWRRADEDLPAEVKEERLARLMELQDRKTRELLETRLGRPLEILLDEPSKKDETRLRGRTRNNLRVIVEARPELRLGTRVRVRPRAIAGSSLLADLVDAAPGG